MKKLLMSVVSGAWAWNIWSLATGQTTSYVAGDDGYYKAEAKRANICL